MVRISEFIYRNLPYITDITTTLDTHFLYQIFFPWFWLDKHDNPLHPFRELLTDEIRSGDVKPNPAITTWLCNGNYPWLLKQVLHYTTELERAGKYKLFLWPPHCLLRSGGHALAGLLEEATMFHGLIRGCQSNCEVKGGHPLTENYSVLRPEVLTRWDGNPLVQKNAAFFQKLLVADAIVIMGEADSHCVMSSIDDLLTEICAVDPKLAKKVHVVTDCMSSVVVRDASGNVLVDYTPKAQDAHQRFADRNMNLVESTRPLEDWNGVALVA